MPTSAKGLCGLHPELAVVSDARSFWTPWQLQHHLCTRRGLEAPAGHAEHGPSRWRWWWWEVRRWCDGCYCDFDPRQAAESLRAWCLRAEVPHALRGPIQHSISFNRFNRALMDRSPWTLWWSRSAFVWSSKGLPEVKLWGYNKLLDVMESSLKAREKVYHDIYI